MKLIFFGAGYCSRYILPRLKSHFEIICTHNAEIKFESFDKELNIKRFILEDFINNKIQVVDGVTHIINSIPPVKNEDLIFKLFSSLDKSMLSKLEWFGYLSSTSVYGDHGGNWVNEESETKPTSLRGENRLKIENLFLSLYENHGMPIHIFRLPGIYGSGRSAIDKLINGNKLIINKPNHFFSRIHVEDIATAILVSMKKKTPGEIFNLTDNYPTSAEDVIKYAAKLLKINDLEITDISSNLLSQKAKSFYNDNKKVSNSKIKKILGWAPKFENYKLGLQNILKKLNG